MLVSLLYILCIFILCLGGDKRPYRSCFATPEAPRKRAKLDPDLFHEAKSLSPRKRRKLMYRPISKCDYFEN